MTIDYNVLILNKSDQRNTLLRLFIATLISESLLIVISDVSQETIFFDATSSVYVG